MQPATNSTTTGDGSQIRPSTPSRSHCHVCMHAAEKNACRCAAPTGPLSSLLTTMMLARYGGEGTVIPPTDCGQLGDQDGHLILAAPARVHIPLLGDSITSRYTPCTYPIRAFISFSRRLQVLVAAATCSVSRRFFTLNRESSHRGRTPAHSRLDQRRHKYPVCLHRGRGQSACSGRPPPGEGSGAGSSTQTAAASRQ